MEQIQASDAWHPLPLDQTTRVLVYGFSEETGETSYQIGPYLTDDSGNPLVPEVQNGYYVLLDRQAEDGKAPGSDILNRAPSTLPLASMTPTQDTLYCCELDT